MLHKKSIETLIFRTMSGDLPPEGVDIEVRTVAGTRLAEFDRVVPWLDEHRGELDEGQALGLDLVFLAEHGAAHALSLAATGSSVASSLRIPVTATVASEADQARVLACRDLDRLDAWTARVLTARDLDEVLAD